MKPWYVRHPYLTLAAVNVAALMAAAIVMPPLMWLLADILRPVGELLKLWVRYWQ